MTATALVSADEALERGEVPTVPHEGSPCEAVAWLVRGSYSCAMTSREPLLIDIRDAELLASAGAVVEVRWYDPRRKCFSSRLENTPERVDSSPRGETP